MSIASIQFAIYRGYGIAGQKLGAPFTLYRGVGSNPIVPGNIITTLPSIFTAAKASGFNFDRATAAEDVTYVVLSDGNQLRVGDYLVGAAATYFIAAMPAMQEIVAVLCSRTVTITTPGEGLSPTGGLAPGLPSQPGSTGTAWGSSPILSTDPLASGSILLASGIPCGVIGTAGRATGTGELPGDSPGPSRWRFYFPPSAVPKGTLHERCVITDEEKSRFQVSSAPWTPLGYRAEVVRLEN